MTQDTRKDRRVKIVSLNVRYKSATVDEFIENHAHDVSRGGIYIKTASPFPPGTLLKFEIRLASDQAVITGVGRVVWKRDTVQGTGDRPSGMGVKFIKIDDPSKAIIDRLVNSRADAGNAYESETEEPHPTASSPPASARPVDRTVGKSTIIGMGAVAADGRPAPTEPRGPAAPPRPAAGMAAPVAMFPSTTAPEPNAASKQEQTVMKQAAELLEEALREAGGTMEDVGTNPLFGGPAPAKSADEPADRDSNSPTMVPEEPTTKSSDAEAARAREIIAGMSPASVAPKKAASSEPPRTSRESPLAKAPAPEDKSPSSARPSSSVRSSPPTSSRPGGRVSVASAPPRARKKKGGAGMIVFLGVVAAAAVGAYMDRDALFGSGASEPAAAPPAPSPSASAFEAPAGSASEAPSAAENTEPSARADGSAGVDSAASAALSASAASAASTAATSTSTASSAPSGTSSSASAASARTVNRPVAPRPSPPVANAPNGESTTAPATTANATSAPTPRPKPIPKAADDNPY